MVVTEIIRVKDQDCAWCGIPCDFTIRSVRQFKTLYSNHSDTGATLVFDKLEELFYCSESCRRAYCEGP